MFYNFKLKQMRKFLLFTLFMLGLGSTFAAPNLTDVLNEGATNTINSAIQLWNGPFGNLIWQIAGIILLFAVVGYLFKVVRKR